LQDRRHSLLTILLTSILVYTIPLMSVDPLFKRIDDAHGRVCTRFGKTRVRIPLGSLNLDKLALKKDLRGNHTPRFRSIFNKKFNIGEEFRAPAGRESLASGEGWSEARCHGFGVVRPMDIQRRGLPLATALSDGSTACGRRPADRTMQLET
jgi:hypothetical protein